MLDNRNVSRRKMLELAGAAGIALAGGARLSEAQTVKRIDRFDSALDAIISPTEPIMELATGFGGGGNTEGPVWWKEGGFLLFSSIGDNRVIKYTPGQGTSV